MTWEGLRLGEGIGQQPEVTISIIQGGSATNTSVQCLKDSELNSGFKCHLDVNAVPRKGFDSERIYPLATKASE